MIGKTGVRGKPFISNKNCIASSVNDSIISTNIAQVKNLFRMKRQSYAGRAIHLYYGIIACVKVKLRESA